MARCEIDVLTVYDDVRTIIGGVDTLHDVRQEIAGQHYGCYEYPLRGCGVIMDMEIISIVEVRRA